jgi:tetratricopeptide (TPR) repeat protein
MAVEIGDWVTERFALPQSLTAYIFVALIAFLPAVAMLAWSHGAPGKDQWKRGQMPFVLINATLALTLSWYVGQQQDPVDTTNAESESAAPLVMQKTITDESGQTLSVSAPTDDAYQRIAFFFWSAEQLNEDDAWMQYGIPFIISLELSRDIFLEASTPITSNAARSRLRETGFPQLLGEPRGLQRSIAREGRMNAFVNGEIDRGQAGEWQITARLYSTSSGALQAEITESGTDLFAISQAISAFLHKNLNVPETEDTNDFSGHIRDHLTENTAAMKAATEGLVQLRLENDYQTALTKFERATDLDSTFALAHMLKAQTLRFMGDFSRAKQALSQANTHSYKLDSEAKFSIRVSEYSLDQDLPTAVKALRTWTEVHPQSTQALEHLAETTFLLGGSYLPESLDAFQRLLELSPSRVETLLDIARVLRQMQRYEEAIGYIQQYLEEDPNNASAYLSLGRIYLFSGKHGAARDTYERARMVGAQERTVDLKLARLDILLGDFDTAEQRFKTLLESASSPQETYQVLSEWMNLRQVQGRIEELLDMVEQSHEAAMKIMSPIQVSITYSSLRAGYLATLGKYEQAHAIVDSAQAQLSPPLDGFLNFARLSIYQASENQPKFEETLKVIDEIQAQFPNPVLEPIVLGAQATRAFWNENYDEGLPLLEAAYESAQRSIIKDQAPFQIFSLQQQIAAAYRKAGELQKAQAILDESLRIFPANPAVLAEQARLYFAQDQVKQAKTLIQQSLQTWQDSDADYQEYREAQDFAAQLGL